MTSRAHQAARVHKARAFAQRWWGGGGEKRAVPVPAEGFCRADTDAMLVDAGGAARQVREPPLDTRALSEWLRPTLALEPTQGHEILEVPMVTAAAGEDDASPPPPPVRVGLFNIVQTSYVQSSAAATTPEGESSSPTTATTALSLRALQRRWLPLGYSKIETCTAIGIQFARPWAGTHLVFPSGRVQRTGSNNRRIDALLFERVTLPIINAPMRVPLRAVRHVSTNVVGKCHIAAPQGISLPLILRRYPESMARLRRHFGNVRIRDPQAGAATLLVYFHGSIVCMGSSSVEGMVAAYAAMLPVLRRFLRTPDVIAQEQRMCQPPSAVPRDRRRDMQRALAVVHKGLATTGTHDGPVGAERISRRQHTLRILDEVVI